jgi:hypothetical protein
MKKKSTVEQYLGAAREVRNVARRINSDRLRDELLALALAYERQAWLSGQMPICDNASLTEREQPPRRRGKHDAKGAEIIYLCADGVKSQSEAENLSLPRRQRNQRQER